MSEDEQQPAADTATRRRRLAAWIAAATAVVIIGGAVAFALVPRDDTAAPAPSTSASSSASPDASPSPSSTEAAPEESPAPETPADPSNPFPEQEPVAPAETGTADGIEARLVQFESVTGEVVGPGDVAAAAVRVTVDIVNTGAAPLDLNLVVMNAYMGEQRDPAETYEQPGGQPVSGSLAPGDTATGVYLFRIPEDRRGDVTFVVDYLAGQPAITWRGQVP